MVTNEIKLVKATYNGSVPSLFDYAGREYALYPGETYELPADALHVQSLIGQQLLLPIQNSK